MAAVTQEQLENASRDADDLAKIVNGGPNDPAVQTRTGPAVPTVASKLAAIVAVEETATASADRAVAAAESIEGSAQAIERIEEGGYHEDPREYELFPADASTATNDRFITDARWIEGFAPRRIDYSAPFSPKNKLVGVGTSLVEQGITPKLATALADPSRLGIQLPTANLGRSGATSLSVALNFEAEVQLYRPVNGVIPAGTDAVALTPAVAGPLESYGGSSGSTVGMLAGVLGTFNWNSSAQTMTFAREKAGAAVGVPYPVPYQPMFYDRDALYQYNFAGAKQRKLVEDARDCFALFWIMRNEIFDQPSNLFYANLAIRRYERLIARLRPRLAGFVVLTEIPSTTERDPAGPSRQHIDAMNRALLRRWPRNAVDITTPFLAADNPPGSLFNDGYLHPSPAGQTIIANTVADFIMSNGLLTDVAA